MNNVRNMDGLRSDRGRSGSYMDRYSPVLNAFQVVNKQTGPKIWTTIWTKNIPTLKIQTISDNPSLDTPSPSTSVTYFRKSFKYFSCKSNSIRFLPETEG